MRDAFFDSWSVLLRTALVGVLAYLTVIVFLRISGNRTLSKLSAFDLIVTVALGSTLATILLNKDVALAEGALALGLLIALQFLITWTSVRVRWVRQLVTGKPALLFYRGQFLHDAMRYQRVTEEEIRAAIRSAGLPTLDGVEAVVLETDGSCSVVRRTDGSNATSLIGVEHSNN